MLAYLTEQLPQVELKVTGFDYQGSLEESDVSGYKLIDSYRDFISKFEENANDQDLLFCDGLFYFISGSTSGFWWEIMRLVDLLDLSCYTGDRKTRKRFQKYISTKERKSYENESIHTFYCFFSNS